MGNVFLRRSDCPGENSFQLWISLKRNLCAHFWKYIKRAITGNYPSNKPPSVKMPPTPRKIGVSKNSMLAFSANIHERSTVWIIFMNTSYKCEQLFDRYVGIPSSAAHDRLATDIHDSGACSIDQRRAFCASLVEKIETQHIWVHWGTWIWRVLHQNKHGRIASDTREKLLKACKKCNISDKNNHCPTYLVYVSHAFVVRLRKAEMPNRQLCLLCHNWHAIRDAWSPMPTHLWPISRTSNIRTA